MAKEKTKETKYVETPLMKQYYGVKAVHGDAILLFRWAIFMKLSARMRSGPAGYWALR